MKKPVNKFYMLECFESLGVFVWHTPEGVVSMLCAGFVDAALGRNARGARSVVVTASTARFYRCRSVKLVNVTVRPGYNRWFWKHKLGLRTIHQGAVDELDLLFPGRKRATLYYRIQAIEVAYATKQPNKT